MSVKPMCSTGMTGQSSSLGIWVIPKTYLQLPNANSSRGAADKALGTKMNLQTDTTWQAARNVPENNVGFL
jgi:hypothetical protein